MVNHFCHPSDPVPSLDMYGLKHYSHTITNVCPRPENTFNPHHSFQDPAYRDILEDNISNFIINGYLE